MISPDETKEHRLAQFIEARAVELDLTSVAGIKYYREDRISMRST